MVIIKDYADVLCNFWNEALNSLFFITATAYSQREQSNSPLPLIQTLAGRMRVK